MTRGGALMSYSFDPVDLFAQAASYIDRILKGASPADLPVQRRSASPFLRVCSTWPTR